MELHIEMEGRGYLLLALLCLVIPLEWLAAALFAAAFHEGCHALAVMIMGGKIYKIKIGAGGALLEASPMTPNRELLSLLAGPAGSLVLLLFRRWIPQAAVCGAVQGIFNLLPVYPLDGGRMLILLCSLWFSPETAQRISHYLAWMTAACILSAGIWGSVMKKLGIAPVVLALILLCTLLKTKISCKEGNQRVQ